ncbi:MAG: hypothetical protein GXO34_05820 [Deltaproteobacteria bacterium]|nr:hypothetical protein [Deltaproteobacteria bacterium]
MKKGLLLHTRPQTVPASALRFRLTWGLGGAAVLMVVVQLTTGLLLNFFYRPTPAGAPVSITHLNNEVFCGRLFHNLHHWTGHALVVIVVLHLLRVFGRAAYRQERYRNWLIGLGLLFLVLLANFSGYLLPWDQRSYWAVTITTAMLGYLPGLGPFLLEAARGGSEVGPATLHLFHTLHSTVLPAGLAVLMLWHFWQIRRAGGLLLKSSGRPGEKPEKLAADPHLFIREKAAAAIILCLLVYAAIFFDAPIGSPANPALTPASVRAPWYFIGFQELLIHTNPTTAILALPLLVVMFLVLFPLADPENPVVQRGITGLFYTLLGGFLILTGTGLFLRGPGMELVWPF